MGEVSVKKGHYFADFQKNKTIPFENLRLSISFPDFFIIKIFDDDIYISFFRLFDNYFLFEDYSNDLIFAYGYAMEFLSNNGIFGQNLYVLRASIYFFFVRKSGFFNFEMVKFLGIDISLYSNIYSGLIILPYFEEIEPNITNKEKLKDLHRSTIENGVPIKRKKPPKEEIFESFDSIFFSSLFYYLLKISICYFSFGMYFYRNNFLSNLKKENSTSIKLFFLQKISIKIVLALAVYCVCIVFLGNVVLNTLIIKDFYAFFFEMEKTNKKILKCKKNVGNSCKN